ncbi:hypothetical protein CRM22_004083 [Opisthorchis felineus]|uniref:FERM domain-containing protein n=1 Tax=Opisthorchis felineus TaxID=147828 RepID=A0A4S2LY12_OPIFE|nr:hypothetical protein CRM22_004083 [Opisthorchis felineus]
MCDPQTPTETGAELATQKLKHKQIEACVILLDSTSQSFHLLPRALGQELYDLVIDHLQLVEYDYFDLEYVNKDGHTFWLDHLKPLHKQITAHKEYLYTFAVKFYTPHPNLLEDEFTRYLFALQVRKDLQTGRLTCSESTAALLAAFIVQGRIGDFLEDIYVDHTYLSGLQLLPTTTVAFLKKVAECHHNLIGQSPAEADFNLLDTVRKVELYGLRMHPAKDNAGLKLNLAVAHSGILVYQASSKISSFSWARIRKVSFKRKRFLIKLHPETYHAAEFVFDSRDECKSFWKQCIEHHAFFRCQAVRQSIPRRGRMVSKGSSFRYTGRTQKQLIEYVRENYVKMPHFERSASAGRVLGAPVPELLLPGLLGAHAHGTHPDTGPHSDYGPSTRLLTQTRPQTDPAQRTHLTDSYLSPDSNRTLTIAIPVGQQANGGGPQFIHGTAQLVRQHRSGSMANEATLPGTLPRGAYLLSAMGTASSGSCTMNSSVSAGSPAPSNSSAGSPQADHKSSVNVPDYSAHFILPSQLRMQDLSLRPVSVASLGTVAMAPSATTLNQPNWRPSSMSRPASPTASSVIIAQSPGSVNPRPVGVAVLPTDPYVTMHASLLVTTQASAMSQFNYGVPLIALGTSAPTTDEASIPGRPANFRPATTFSVGTQPQQAHQLLRTSPIDPNFIVDPSKMAQSTARLKLPPGYALLAGPSGIVQSGNRIIYIDRATGKPLLPLLTSGGQLVVDNSSLPLGVVRQSPVPGGGSNQVVSESIVGQQLSTMVTSTTAASAAVSASMTAPPTAFKPTLPTTTAVTQPTASSDSVVVNGVVLRSRRPPGPPPPAPERRDSMLPRIQTASSQRSSLSADPGLSPKPSSHGPSLAEKVTNMLDSGAEDEVSPTNSKMPHPLAMGLITGPNGMHSASCLSLAGRGRSTLSTRSLCATTRREMSDGTDDDGSDGRKVVINEGGSQSDTEKSIVRSSLFLDSSFGGGHAVADDEEDDDHYSVCSQRSTLRSRSASCRHRHRHRQRHPHSARCHLVTDPATEAALYDLPQGNSTEICNGGADSILFSTQPRRSHSSGRLVRHRLDTAYQLICDLVMTERTYGRDLSVVCVCFRHSLTCLDDELVSPCTEAHEARLPNDLATELFDLLDPIYVEHQKLLASFEARVSSWNGRKVSDDLSNMLSTGIHPLPLTPLAEQQPSIYCIGDLFLAHLSMIPFYQRFMANAERIMLLIEEVLRSNPELEQQLRQFEAQKICYLPFYVFLLKPMHRLLQYRVTLERLMRYYSETHPDAPDCRVVHARLLDLIQSQWESYKRLENTYKLLEIQRDLMGLSSFPSALPDSVETSTKPQQTVATEDLPGPAAGPLIRSGRQFIREGWLQKLSKKGYQPRMFFLFSDQLVYAGRTAAAYLQFKVHGQFPLHDLMVEEAEPAYSFTVFSGNRCFLVAAPSDWQRDRWLEDISRAILAAKTKPSQAADKSVEPIGILNTDMKNTELTSASDSELSQLLQRATTSVHVCWHRCFTVSMQDILRANEVVRVLEQCGRNEPPAESLTRGWTTPSVNFTPLQNTEQKGKQIKYSVWLYMRD